MSATQPSQADQLVELAAEAELWHSPDGVAYATFEAGEHFETHGVRRKAFRSWLLAMYHANHAKAPNSNAVQSALNTLEGLALYRGEQHPVFLRCAEYDKRIYLDLGGDDWSAVEITPNGWNVVPRPPVRFQRGRAMLALARPERGGSLGDLRCFLNVESDADFRLLLSVAIAYLRPRGPYPILVLQGEQGSAKSTTARIIKSLIDPAKASLRTRPRDESDLIISANHGFVLCFDNLSTLPDYLSDGLCRLATGGGLAKRELYSDADEVVLEALRPTIINGIADVVARDDLRDRSVVLTLPTIRDGSRRDEERFWAAFEEARPRLLGALLDAVSIALSRINDVKMPAPPRMADFARWSSAAGPAIGWDETHFLTAYAGNRMEAAIALVEGDPVVQAVVAAIPFDGTCTELLKKLNAAVSEDQRRAKGWPADATRLSSWLKRHAPALRLTYGIEMVFTRMGKRRGVRIEGKEQETSVTSVTESKVVREIGDAHAPADNAVSDAGLSTNDADDGAVPVSLPLGRGDAACGRLPGR